MAAIADRLRETLTDTGRLYCGANAEGGEADDVAPN